MSSPEGPSRARAKPLAPDERRAAIIAATTPLVRKYGADVTTRQIAEAAGVAEGTLFRVFPDKDALLRATVSMVMDPSESVRRLESIDRGAPLYDRVVAAVVILHDLMAEVIDLAAAVGRHQFREWAQTHERGKHEEAGHAALAAILEPDRDGLRCTPDRAAQLLEMLAFSNAHPHLNRGQSFAPNEIASLLLDGIRRQAQ